MKLRLPSLLISAIVALQLSSTVRADYVGNGVIYDVGKTAFSSDNIPNNQLDANFCWAAGASNIIAYWQDTYGKATADDWSNTPKGYTDYNYSNPTGTKYLQVYDYGYQHAPASKQWDGTMEFPKGQPYDYIEWYMRGKDCDELNSDADYKGFYSSLFNDGSKPATKAYDIDYGENYQQYFEWEEGESDPTNMAPPAEGEHSNKQQWINISDFIKEAFTVQGQAVTLCINGGHIINCWGYETDETGLVTALILTNMDDSTFGAFRAKIGIEQATVDVYDWFEPAMYGSYGERLILQTDDDMCLGIQNFQGQSQKAWLANAYAINTPTEDEVEINGEIVNLKDCRTLVAANDTIQAKQVLAQNTRLNGSDTIIHGQGIQVGDKTNAIVLTSAGDEKLTLSGLDETAHQKAETAGMVIEDGGMVSLRNLEISGYAKDGIDNKAKSYLHNGTVAIYNNDGAGIHNSDNDANSLATNYFELQDCDSVTISNNAGGGIVNEQGTVSIRGNKTVVFQNTANGKNDIYNETDARFNISDNGSVLFKGEDNRGASENVAVVNKGVMNMSAGAGKEITFQNTTLKTEGEGKTYIGQDISARSTDTAGKVHFTSKNGGDLSVQANAYDSYATLENLSINANEISAAGSNVGTLTNAIVTAVGPLTMSNVTLNSTDVITSASKDFITLENVVVTLTSDDFSEGSFDLTGVFRGNFKLTGLTLDLSDSSLSGEVLNNLIFDMSSAYANPEQLENVIIRTSQGTSSPASVGTILLASEPLPEPTTGTLGLLALAGLCGRRRRR